MYITCVVCYFRCEKQMFLLAWLLARFSVYSAFVYLMQYWRNFKYFRYLSCHSDPPVFNECEIYITICSDSPLKSGMGKLFTHLMEAFLFDPKSHQTQNTMFTVRIRKPLILYVSLCTVSSLLVVFLLVLLPISFNGNFKTLWFTEDRYSVLLLLLIYTTIILCILVVISKVHKRTQC